MADIYLREKDGIREIRFPILPEKIVFKSGEASFISYDIMDRGEVAVPSGTGLAGYSWESRFPGEYSPEMPAVRGTWYAPDEYEQVLEDWKTKRTKLNLLVTSYRSFNKDVYIQSYEGEGSGACGDIVYQISLLEARDIVITTSKAETPSSQSSTKRPATKSSSYTIKSGDTLWAIAAMSKHYGDGSKWQKIYSANKEIIEATAKKHGRSSSQNGHWIYPGVTLTIPDVTGSSTSSGSGSSSKPSTSSGAGSGSGSGSGGGNTAGGFGPTSNDFNKDYMK